ncbi:hypothetical protein EAG_13744 [Camponotus floridanus]|uniref:Uncharacterized protein n=1 Tax=Camponotus floridanus TaxID=104421 RepID=E2AJU9_CAMFO|nr:hypothetical protein EAG_13744 [Camponotus floridanus]
MTTPAAKPPSQLAASICAHVLRKQEPIRAHEGEREFDGPELDFLRRRDALKQQWQTTLGVKKSTDDPQLLSSRRAPEDRLARVSRKIFSWISRGNGIFGNRRIRGFPANFDDSKVPTGRKEQLGAKPTRNDPAEKNFASKMVDEYWSDMPYYFLRNQPLCK